MSGPDDSDPWVCSGCKRGAHDQCAGCDCEDSWHYEPGDDSGAPPGPSGQMDVALVRAAHLHAAGISFLGSLSIATMELREARYADPLAPPEDEPGAAPWMP